MENGKAHFYVLIDEKCKKLSIDDCWLCRNETTGGYWQHKLGDISNICDRWVLPSNIEEQIKCISPIKQE